MAVRSAGRRGCESTRCGSAVGGELTGGGLTGGGLTGGGAMGGGRFTADGSNTGSEFTRGCTPPADGATGGVEAGPGFEVDEFGALDNRIHLRQENCEL